MNDLISVIVPVYNRADALDAVLRSLARQSEKNFEIIIADDGSGPAIKSVISKWAPRLGVPIRHVWHEDRGFCLPEIRNKALHVASGRYIVWLDGDCIARADFVASHRALAEPGYFVSGNRVLLSEPLTLRVLSEKLDAENWSMARWLWMWVTGQANRVVPLISLPLGPIRKLKQREWEGVRGANMAYHRDDLEKIDGFDASYVGYGPEDSDLVIRAIRSGVKRKDGRFATGVLHLWHMEADRARIAQNRAMLGDLLRSDRVRAVQGLSSVREDAACGRE